MKTRFDIITVGAATRDVFLRSKAIRVVRDDNFSTGEAECFALGSKIDIDELVFETGGGASNAAVGFARQGFRTAFVGKIGAHDARGGEVVKAMQHEKVNVSLVRKDLKQGTGYSVLLLTPRGERTALVFRGASADFKPKDLPSSKLSAKWIYVTSLGGELPIIRELWQRAKLHNIKIAWNPGAGELALGLQRLRPYIAACDIFMVNQEEAARLMNLTREQDAEAFHQIRQMSSGVTVVTQGTEGSLAGTSTSAWHAGTHHVHVTDTTGAGDAFGAGFVGQFIRSGKIPAALQFATNNSESVLQHIGAKAGLLRRAPRARPVPVTVLE